MQLFTEKSERLKQAKKEAEKEIAAYRQQREEAYKKQISDVRQQRHGLMCLAMPEGTMCWVLTAISAIVIAGCSGREAASGAAVLWLSQGAAVLGAMHLPV